MIGRALSIGYQGNPVSKEEGKRAVEFRAPKRQVYSIETEERRRCEHTPNPNRTQYSSPRIFWLNQRDSFLVRRREVWCSTGRQTRKTPTVPSSSSFHTSTRKRGGGCLRTIHGQSVLKTTQLRTERVRLEETINLRTTVNEIKGSRTN